MLEDMPDTPTVEAGPGYVLVTGHRYKLQIFTSSVQWEGPGDGRHSLIVMVGAGGGDSGDGARGGLGEIAIQHLVGEELPGTGEDGHTGLFLALTRW